MSQEQQEKTEDVAEGGKKCSGEEPGKFPDMTDLHTDLPATSGTVKPTGTSATSEGAAAGDASKKSGSSSSGGKPSAQTQYPELMKTMQELLDSQRRGGKQLQMLADGNKEKDHQFWSTQPVPKYEEKVPNSVNDPIEIKSVEEVRKEPYQLPGGYFWDTLDVNNKDTLEELYTLLHDNYVEDDDAMFRFRYSHDFLLWALKPPGWTKDWHLGVRVDQNKKLVGFISAVPSQMRVHGKSMHTTEVNFLCVHKKLRTKRMAVILIKEITRRCNIRGIFQAVYTAGALLPKPVGTCRYWHRSINPQKLVDVSFSSVGKNMTVQRMKKLYKVPEQPKTPGFRLTESKDVPAVFQLLTNYLKKFEMAPEFTIEEVEHYFVPKDKIIYSYVVEGGEGITDFVSFYSLPSTVVNHTTHDSIYAAYSFYNVASKTSWEDLITDALVMAKKNGFDVFNALDLMDNGKFISQLKFGIGDGALNYYIYNWKCWEMQPAQIGLVLM